MLVGERMTRDPLTIGEDANIDDALHMMRERKVRRLPVLDQTGKMVGIISDKDLLDARLHRRRRSASMRCTICCRSSP